MVNSSLKLDRFKERMLQCLDEKEEEGRFYPIEKADLMTLEICAVCGSSHPCALTEVYSVSGLNFFSTSVCPDCLYTFRSVSPTYQWFKKCWEMISTKKLEVFNPEEEQTRKSRYERYCNLLSAYTKNPLVLDVGAGYGAGSMVMRDHGYLVEALEPEPDRAHYIEKCLPIPIHPMPVEEFIPQRNYGLVILSHCLEHLDDPALVLSHIRNLLDPEVGILYVEIPVLWNSITWSDALYLTHKSNFTLENMTYLSERHGLEILEKVWHRQKEGEPWDLGLVMRPTKRASSIKSDFSPEKGGHDIDDVRRLYRKDIPVTTPPLGAVIKYLVPYIDHFYCTLRFHTKKIVEPHPGSSCVSFEPM